MLRPAPRKETTLSYDTTSGWWHHSRDGIQVWHVVPGVEMLDVLVERSSKQQMWRKPDHGKEKPHPEHRTRACDRTRYRSLHTSCHVRLLSEKQMTVHPSIRPSILFWPLLVSERFQCLHKTHLWGFTHSYHMISGIRRSWLLSFHMIV